MNRIILAPVVLCLACEGPHTPVEALPDPASPLPHWPVVVDCDELVPEEVCARFIEDATADSVHFISAKDGVDAEVQLNLSGKTRVGELVLALAAPFFTIEKGVELDALRSSWTGPAVAPFDAHPLQATEASASLMTQLWGPAGPDVQLVDSESLVDQSFDRDAWTLLRYEDLHPHLRVLEIDGLTPLHRELSADYGLQVPLYIETKARTDAQVYLPKSVGNRDPDKLTVVALTGVTALTRGTSGVMEREGITFPARDVADLLRAADLTHISNEVSFSPECPRPHPRKTMKFCSHSSYIEVLDFVGADIIELTGNHNNDYGRDGFNFSLDLYEERGWKWYGGGRNLEDAHKRAEVVHGPNRLAFLGCNAVGPSSSFAREDQPGGRACEESWQFDALLEDVKRTREEGWLPIVTVQYWETYKYYPTGAQRTAFEQLADAGAVVVSGSQAHQAQGFGLRTDSVIHYGPGNLFFDQMQSLGTRQEFVDYLVFYDGRLLSIELHTLLLEDYARPRPMDAEERAQLLKSVFKVSHRQVGEKEP